MRPRALFVGSLLLGCAASSPAPAPPSCPNCAACPSMSPSVASTTPVNSESLPKLAIETLQALNDHAWTIRLAHDPESDATFDLVARLAEKRGEPRAPGLPADARIFYSKDWRHALAALPNRRLILLDRTTAEPLFWRWSDRVVVDRANVPKRGEVLRLRGASAFDEEIFSPADGRDLVYAMDQLLLWDGGALAYLVDFSPCRASMVDLSEGGPAIPFAIPFAKTADDMRCEEAFLTTDGGFIGTDLGRWSTKTRKFLPFPPQLDGCELSPDGRWIVCFKYPKGTMGGSPPTHVIDVATGKERVVLLGGPEGPGTDGGPGMLATGRPFSFTDPPNVQLRVSNYGTYLYSLPDLKFVDAWPKGKQYSPPPLPPKTIALAPETLDENALHAKLDALVCHVGGVVLPRKACAAKP